MVKRVIIAILYAFTGHASFAADAACYDLKVRAVAISQIPSIYPRSDDPNVIVMSWPWFLDLKVNRVIEGETSAGVIEALAVMHVKYVRKNLTWFLRKNAAGTYNVIRSDEPEKLIRCGADLLPARPPITPAPGQSYGDLRKEGETGYRGLGGNPE
ncbi:MAG: hypothetical protein ABGW87_01240 [Sphingomonadaceae bacterium]